MATKHVLNDSRELVNESLLGLARLNPNIRIDEANRVVLLSKVPKDRVALVCDLLLLFEISGADPDDLE
jgi:dihydroxyacetone kinase